MTGVQTCALPISAERPSTNAYVAVEDSYCFQLPAADFLKLLELSPSFQLFCTRYIASLLNQSREQLQVQFSQRAAEQQTMTTSLSNLVTKAPVFVAPSIDTRSALEKMAAAGVGCLAVACEDEKPVGVLTQSDILKRILLPGFDLTRPISEVMTTPPHTLHATASAYDAALEMATHGVRHILVVDTEEKLKGVISERDLFALQRIGLRQIRSGIESAADVPALQRASRDIRQLAPWNKLLDRLGSAPDVMTYVNSDSYKRLFEAAPTGRNEYVSRILNGVQAGLASLRSTENRADAQPVAGGSLVRASLRHEVLVVFGDHHELHVERLHWHERPAQRARLRRVPVPRRQHDRPMRRGENITGRGGSGRCSAGTH